MASNPSALDKGCRRHHDVTVFTVNEKDPDLIVVDFGFEHTRAEGLANGGRHDASIAASPALICLEAGPWQQIRCVGDCCDSKACPARRLGKLQGLDPMSVVNTMNRGRMDIVEYSCISALQKMRMASSARAKLGNKEKKQVTERFERSMEDASVQLRELHSGVGNKWILNKPGARCQSVQHMNPVHWVQSTNDVARSLASTRRLTQESHSLSINEKTSQTPGLTHTQPSNKLKIYTSKMRCHDWRLDPLIDTTCLFFGAIAGPPIQWVTLQSMHIGSNSVLDQKILQVLPFSAKLVAALESHQTVAMALMFSSTSMSVALLCKVAAKTTGSARSAVFICFWLAMVIGASAWNTIGGSAAEFFPVFLPVATTVGAISGLLWRCR